MQRHIGAGLSKVIAHLLGTDDPETVSAAVRLYREEYLAGGMYEATLYGGIEETLAQLSGAKEKLFVATAKNERVSRLIIPHFGLSGYFHQVYGGQEDESRTHKTELITHILQVENLDPADCVMVGDRYHDIAGAKTNGMKSIGVAYGFGGREELLQAGADAVIDDPKALLKLLL